MKHGKQIKMAIIGCLAVFMITWMAGCAGSPGMTEKAIDRRHYHALYTDWLMFQDDLDAIFMLDRPSRLTPMYSR